MTPWDLLLIVLQSIAGSLAFAVVFCTPRRYLALTGLIGSIAGVSINLCPRTWHVGFSALIVSLAVACLSHLVARFTKAPAQCFLIPGVILLVPGTYVYRAFAAALSGSMTDATLLTLQALTITVGVSFGILLANWLVPPRKTL